MINFNSTMSDFKKIMQQAALSIQDKQQPADQQQQTTALKTNVTDKNMQPSDSKKGPASTEERKQAIEEEEEDSDSESEEEQEERIQIKK